MDYRMILQDSLDYIEENLKTEITPKELSDRAGFSLFHYYRLFQSVTGLPVMQYIICRRLLNAIYAIRCGQKMADAALEYGFDTYAGFYRAFQREFHCSPSAFLKTYRVKKPYRIRLFQEDCFMLTHKKAAAICRHWNLEQEPVSDIYYENTGEKSSSAYWIGSAFVLKFTTSLEKLQRQIALSQALEKSGLLAAAPLPTQNGEKYVKEGELYCFLTKRLDGHCLNSRQLYQEGSVEKARFIGESLGHLHLALQHTDLDMPEQNLYETVKNWAMPKAREILQLPDSLCRDYKATFGRLYPLLPVQIIHRDPHLGNLLLDKDGWNFIDFELAEKNLRIFDPCYAASSVLSENFSEGNCSQLEHWISLYQNILYGYDSIAKLSREELQAVPYVLLSNQLICVAWFSQQEKHREILETNKKMTKWMAESFEQLRIP